MFRKPPLICYLIPHFIYKLACEIKLDEKIGLRIIKLFSRINWIVCDIDKLVHKDKSEGENIHLKSIWRFKD